MRLRRPAAAGCPAFLFWPGSLPYFRCNLPPASPLQFIWQGSFQGIGGERVSIFLFLFIVLFLAWLFAWAIFHLAGGALHVLLIVAVIALIWHFVKGARRGATA